MREPLEIIADLKHVTHWSQPNIKFEETMHLLNELESALTPIIEETPPPEPTIKEPITEEPLPVQDMTPPDGTGLVTAMDVIEPPTENVTRPKRERKK